MDKDLVKILACPRCKSSLKFEQDKLICSKCKKAFKIKEGIPILI